MSGSRPNIYNLTLEQLDEMPTLHQGQFDNLKFEDNRTRVWLSRMSIDDGMPANHIVTIEHLVGGYWEQVHSYIATKERPNV